MYLTLITAIQVNIAMQETKTFTILGEVGVANEILTKTTQTSVWMAQHNEQTRLRDLSCTPTYQPMCTLKSVRVHLS